MSKKDKKNETPVQDEVLEQQGEESTQAQQPPEEAPAGEPQNDPMLAELESLKDQVAKQEDKYLRLCAEYDNYRKRTAKEKEAAWTDAKAETASAFLPVYDNLERALKQ